MSQLIQFAPQVERLSGALFPAKNNEATIKVFGKEAKVILEGFVEAMTKKDEDRSIFGRLNCKAVKMESKGKERLVLVFDGGIQGVLFKKKSEEFLENEDDNSPDYTGEIVAEENKIFPLFGRNAESKKGEAYISLSTGPRKPRSQEQE